MSSTILVVDDHKDLLDTVSYALEDLGYSVVKAQNGAEALEILERQSVDVLLIDFVMPGKVRSIDVANHVRKIRPEALVIFASGYNFFDEDLIGPSDRLQKPYTPQSVDRLIKNHQEVCAIRGIGL